MGTNPVWDDVNECFNCSDFRRAPVQTGVRDLSVGNPANSTPLLFKRGWGFLMFLYCMLS